MSDDAASSPGDATAPSPTDPGAAVTFLWDFFGPNATGTATHFEKHLRQFLEQHSLVGCETGTASEGAGHMAAFCVTPPAAVATVEGALRPKRRREAPPGSSSQG